MSAAQQISVPRRDIPQLWLNIGLVVVLFASMALALTMSTGQRAVAAQTDPEIMSIILWELRLPRVILGVLVGATLGLSGAALQGLLRNPLAEPGLIGVSGGAAFGAVMVFYFTVGGAAFWVPAGGVIGALVALGALYLLAGQNPSITSLILAGVAINAFGAALTSLALNFAPNPYAALEIVFWLMGSLVDRSVNHIWMVLPFMIIGTGLVISAARALDALTLGEDTASSLGFNPQSIKFRIIAGTGLAVGAAVSVTGVISFIGLVVPHLLRPLTGFQPSRLLLPSALAGAALLTLADIFVRLLSTEYELRIGVVTALLGAPFFLYLIVKTRRAAQ